VIDAPTRETLYAILCRESLSMLCYVGEAYPWTTARGHYALDRLQKIVRTEREAVVALGRFLARKHVPLPYIGSFPHSFTTINFLSLEYLIPKLIETEKQSIADLEKDLPSVHHGDAKAEVEKLLTLKREHLRQMEEFTPLPKAAV
jgi:hypothetical protein